MALAFTSPAAHATFPGLNGKIAFHSNRDGNFEIYVMDANGANQTRITTSAGDDLSPTWSADGTKLAFTSFRDGNYEIYTMNADGTGQTRITNNAAADVAPAWSPDGTKIVFGSLRDGNSELYTMSSNGTGVTRITTNAAVDGQANWSPDGTKIAFATNRDGNFEIYTMNADGTSPARITSSSNDEMEPGWAPHGGNIVFQHEFPGGTTSEITYCSAAASCYQQFTNITGGELEKEAVFSPDNAKAATLQDVPLAFNFTCLTTPVTTIGSSCATTTSVDAVLGGTSGITEGKRAIWNLDDIGVSDGGADGVASTTGDNTLFVSDGLFLP